MAEVGLDLSKEFPKPLTTDVVQSADVVITMGCGDACPIFPDKRYLDLELNDPPASTSTGYGPSETTSTNESEHSSTVCSPC
jgi:arsenate reductase